MWSIDKRFDFCYGHRVHCQTLNDNYTERGHTKAKCRHLHGHQGHAHVFLDATELNDQGMVVDFTWLGWLKNFLDDYIDHKFILDRNDPWLNNIISGTLEDKEFVESKNNVNYIVNTPCVVTYKNQDVLPLKEVYVPDTFHMAGHVIDTTDLEDGDEKDFYDSFFLVTFIPTSENLSKWLFECVDQKMKLINVKTTEVSWFETPKSRSTYKGIV